VFAKRLKELRNNNKFSQAMLAEKLGFSQQAVAKWEAGESTPNPETLSKISELFGVSADYLLGLSDYPDGREADISFDDFTYAMHNESKHLSEAEKQMLLDMARIMKAKMKERKKNGQSD
jgi:transcriptional regulator with XRE-family HTH domain